MLEDRKAAAASDLARRPLDEAARARRNERDERIVGLLNRGVAVADIAQREGVSLKRMRNCIRELLARREPQPPTAFLAEARRLEAALSVPFSMMANGATANFRAIDAVIAIVRALDRCHGFSASPWRGGARLPRSSSPRRARRGPRDPQQTLDKARFRTRARRRASDLRRRRRGIRPGKRRRRRRVSKSLARICREDDASARCDVFRDACVAGCPGRGRQHVCPRPWPWLRLGQCPPNLWKGSIRTRARRRGSWEAPARIDSHADGIVLRDARCAGASGGGADSIAQAPRVRPKSLKGLDSDLELPARPSSRLLPMNRVKGERGSALRRLCCPRTLIRPLWTGKPQRACLSGRSHFQGGSLDACVDAGPSAISGRWSRTDRGAEGRMGRGRKAAEDRRPQRHVERLFRLPGHRLGHRGQARRRRLFRPSSAFRWRSCPPITRTSRTSARRSRGDGSTPKTSTS